MPRASTRRFGLAAVTVLATACAFHEPDCNGSAGSSDASMDTTPGPSSPDCNP